MGSSLPTAQCSPGRTGGDRASRKRCHPQRRDRWGSSTLSPQPYWLVAAGWGEPTTRSCSPSLAPHTAEGREAMVTRCPGEQRGGQGRKKCPGPSRRTPSRLPEPHRPPHGRPGGTFPRTAHLRCCKRAPRCPAARARQGRGNTGDGSGTGTESCRRQPPKHHPAPGEASLHPPHLAGTLGRSPGTSQAGPGSAGARG